MVVRFTFSQFFLELVVADFELMTTQIAAGSINRYTPGLVGRQRIPTHATLVDRLGGSLKSAISRLTSGRSGRVGSSIAFFH